MGSTIRTIYLPSTITNIAQSTSYGYNMVFGNGYAHKVYVEDTAEFKAALKSYYEYVIANFTGTAAQTLDKVTINDKTVQEYIAE